MFFLLFSFSVESSFAAGKNFENGVAKASIAFGAAADLQSITVKTIDIPNDYAYINAYMWGADETTPPKRIIKAITVLRNDQTIYIPLSAYVDLGNPRELSIKKLPAHGFQLMISGGDAAGSYNAKLIFKKNEISRRKLVNGEFPKEVWEETIYSFNHLNN